jgi:hypothetical protein
VWSPPWRAHSFRHDHGSLARQHWRYLQRADRGRIAALNDPIRLATAQAVRCGADTVTRDLLDTIT